MEARGRVAVVTGAAAGAGRVIALALAELGAAVLVTDVDDVGGEETVAGIEERGGRAAYLRVDVCDDIALGAMVERALRLGEPAVLVNNAGGWGGAGRQYPDAAPADWGRVLDLNLRGPMLATQLMLQPLRRAGGGAVVNIASGAGLELSPYRSPEYGAAKAGLIRFSAALAGLGASTGVRVNCVVPGWIGLDRARAQLAAMTPERRAGVPPLVPPERVAAAVARLVTDDELSGRVMVLRGGRDPELLEPAAFE